MYSRTPTPFVRQRLGERREPSYRRMSGLPPNYGGTMLRTIQPWEEEASPRIEELPTTGEQPAVSSSETEDVTAQDIKTAVPSRPTGLFSFMDSHRFPFGHGIGYEEMLLLGLIFFLVKECDGEGDLKETLILLGLLLLGG